MHNIHRTFHICIQAKFDSGSSAAPPSPSSAAAGGPSPWRSQRPWSAPLFPSSAAILFRRVPSAGSTDISTQLRVVQWRRATGMTASIWTTTPLRVSLVNFGPDGTGSFRRSARARPVDDDSRGRFGGRRALGTGAVRRRRRVSPMGRCTANEHADKHSSAGLLAASDRGV